MRKFNSREKEFLKLLERISNLDLEFFSYFMQNEFFTQESNSGLILLTTQKAALLYIKKNIFDDQKTRKEELRKFMEIVSLTEYLKQNRLIDLIPNPQSQLPNMLMMRKDFDAPIQTTPTSDLFLNRNGLHFKHRDFSKIYDSNNNIVFEAVQLGKHTYDLVIENFMGLLFVSEELKVFVQNDFKSDEDIRYTTNLVLTWIGIGLAIIFGIIGIYNPFEKQEDRVLRIHSHQFDSIYHGFEKVVEELNNQNNLDTSSSIKGH